MLLKINTLMKLAQLRTYRQPNAVVTGRLPYLKVSL